MAWCGHCAPLVIGRFRVRVPASALLLGRSEHQKGNLGAGVSLGPGGQDNPSNRAGFTNHVTGGQIVTSASARGSLGTPWPATRPRYRCNNPGADPDQAALAALVAPGSEVSVGTVAGMDGHSDGLR